jgi:gliding motility-associated-like protein
LIFYRFLLIFALFLYFNNTTNAQVCTGTFGEVSWGTTFGRGTSQYGGPLKSENTGIYDYFEGQPEDTYYTIVKKTPAMSDPLVPNKWHIINNHTPNDPDGYFMLINADLIKNIFYKETITDLCPNTSYEFSAFVSNLVIGDGGNPKLVFTIEDALTNTVLLTFSPPEIAKTTAPEWKQLTTIFRTTANTGSIIIKIRNDAPGGLGNDLALDDITFRACGPIMIPRINGTASASGQLCEGTTENFTLAVDVQAGVYVAPEYQWQKWEGNTWINIPGETNNSTNVQFINAVAGVSQFRMLASEQGSINSVACRTASPPVTFTTLSYPNPVVSSNGKLCMGSSILLDVDVIGTYRWINPSGQVFSNLKSPVIINATPDMTGLYTVEVTNAGGCVKSASIAVTVLPDLQIGVRDAVLTKCLNGSPVQLEALGGISYKWYPEEGLSNSTLANPFANPAVTTIYTVLVSNGVCERSASVKVVINENAIANAGNDKETFIGESVVLDGSVTGDKVSYFWTPAEGLDDPSKLNPIATPTRDIVYTLTAISDEGCNTATDQVALKILGNVVVPNTFSPNGDGINDFWNLASIADYPTSVIKVVNRDGQLIYQGNGRSTSWDGKYKGQDVPVGAYYYIITLNSKRKNLTGWVMIVR